MATIAVQDGERDVHVIFELRIRPDIHLLLRTAAAAAAAISVEIPVLRALGWPARGRRRTVTSMPRAVTRNVRRQHAVRLFTKQFRPDIFMSQQQRRSG